LRDTNCMDARHLRVAGRGCKGLDSRIGSRMPRHMPHGPALEDPQTPQTAQHERLLRIGWITGFVDGEGCFSINFIRQPDRRARKGYRTGFQVGHEFAVTQGAKSVGSLYAFVEFFGIGDVYKNARYDNHKEHLFRYCVRRRADLVGTIIPFFTSYPLQTSKQGDFQKFAECVRRMETGVH
jgi:hypothetical protein